MAMRRLWLVLVLTATSALAAPRMPASDSEVLERLPGRPTDRTAGELRRLRAAASASPGDQTAAAALARRYFDLAMAEGDPRYVGYAEGVLRPWKGKSEASAEVLLIGALLRQARHDFAGALPELARALERDPNLTEAYAWRAAIYTVQADYSAARRECQALAGHASELFATGCVATVEGVTGHAASAYAKLKASLDKYPGASPELKLWIQTRLAEMAWRLDRYPVAERHFREALALGVADNYLLAAYADFLLERGRPAEVTRLLKDRDRSDTLLLRLALAERTLKAPSAASRERILAERFADSALRGERLHLAEEARFLLELRAAPAEALAAARENWKSQREPRDATILLEAALAAGDAEAAAPALDWLRASGYESTRVAGYAERLRKARP